MIPVLGTSPVLYYDFEFESNDKSHRTGKINLNKSRFTIIIRISIK